MSAMSLVESKRLVELEGVIRRGKQAFVEVGNALVEIRDSKLWRYDYKTFEDYCHKVWGWKKSYSYMLMGSASVIKGLPEKFSAMAENPKQVRELAKIVPERRVEVLEKAAAKTNGKLTAKAIRETAKDLNLAQPGRLPVSPPTKPAEPPPSKRRKTKPTIEVPSEVAFVEREEERLSQPEKTPVQMVIDDLKEIWMALELEENEPNPISSPDFAEIANQLIACARTLRTIAKEAA